METVTVSSEFPVVIPHAVRELLGIRPGQKLLLIPHRNRLELVPQEPIEGARGFLAGIDTTVQRDADI